jgi:nucleoside-diphosphate-sugar epimerase
MEKILITGATGFIGSHLVEECVKQKKNVRILALPADPKAKEYEQQGLSVVYGDICDYPTVEKAITKMDIVFHLAAVVTDWAPKKLYQKINVEGMRNVCEAALKSGVQRLVEVSTNDVFGLKENVTIDESFDYTYWKEPYPDTKIEAAKIAWNYYKEGLPVTMVYPCWAYGPGDTTFVPLTADAIYKHNLIFWRKKTRVWPVYVDNLIDLLMTVAEHPKAIGEGFLVHDGESLSYQAFCQKIAAALGTKPPKTHIPYWLAYGLAWMMESLWKFFGIKTRPLLTTYTVKNLGSNLDFSIQKADAVLGWKPKVPFQTGFEKTMAWLKQTYPSQWKQK